MLLKRFEGKMIPVKMFQDKRLTKKTLYYAIEGDHPGTIKL